MRRLWLYIFFSALLLGILPGVTSCRQKDLVFPEAGMAVLDLRFEWPDTLTERPEGMTIWFFSMGEDARIWRFDIAGHEGGPVELPYGDYTAISCNNDVSAIRISDTSAPHRLTASLKQNDTIAPPLTPLYRALALSVSFSPSGLSWTEDGIASEHHGKIPTLMTHPAKISTSYNIEVRGIQGAERMQAASMRLHGVCSDLLLYDAHSFGMTLDFASRLSQTGTEGVLHTAFESFGPLLDTEDATIEVIVTLNTRRTYRKNFDVSDQISNRLDPLCVKIVIEGLSIPDDGEPPEEDVGMEVGVDGWTEINIDYTTGT